MPTYYFDTYEHGKFSRDTVGIELPDLDAVQREAVLGAKEILAERLKHGEVLDGEEFWIRDEVGNVVLKIPLKSVVREA